MEKAIEFIGGGILLLMMLGFTNVFGDKLNWWYLIYSLAN